MAVRYAVASGNWSNTATWDGGTLPSSGDDVYADGKTVNIDQNITVLNIRRDQRSGGTIGGTFTCSTTQTVNAGIVPYADNTTTPVVTFSGTTGTTLTINGNLYTAYTGGNGSAWRGVETTSTGTLNLNGNICPNSPGNWQNASVLAALVVSGASTVNITGIIYGYNVGNSNANYVCVTLTGIGHTLNVTGDVNGRLSINQAVSGTINVTGNVYGGSSSGWSSNAISTASSGVCNITGTVNGSPISGYSVYSASGATVTVIGSLPAGTGACVGGGGTLILSGPFISSATGLFPIQSTGIVKLTGISNNEMRFVKSSGGTTSLYSADVISGTPATPNVRYGTVYGGGSLTGTCRIPAASSVSYGVPVDNTVGTASLSPADVAAIIGKQISAAISTI